MEPTRFSMKFDNTRQLGQAAGFELDFRQLSYGRQATHAEYLVGKHVTVVHVRFNRAFHQKGYAPPGAVTVGIPYIEVRRWFEANCSAMNILPFNQASGFDCVSNEGFAGWTLSISEAYLQQVADTCKLPFNERLRRPATAALIAESAEIHKLHEVLSACTRHASFLLDPMAEERIAIALLSAAETGKSTERSAPAVRTRALSTALEYLRHNEHEPVKIQEICASTGIAARTLERAFKEHFGIGPKAYQQRLRLNAARDALLTVGRERAVVDIANHWGFWHMGQFAKDYRALFGELPSQTLASQSV